MDFLQAALINTIKHLGEGSLVRTSGSYVKDLGDVDHAYRTVNFLVKVIGNVSGATTDAINAGYAKPLCLYFRGPVPSGYEAFSAFVNLEELTDKELDSVCIVTTGDSFQLRGKKKEIPVRRTNIVHLITGPYINNDGERHQVIYSWTPGHLHPETPLDNATVRPW